MLKRAAFSLLTITLLFGIASVAAAQDAKPRIQLKELETEGISADEKHLVQSLIVSYLADIGQLTDTSAVQLTDDVLPDYEVSGSVHQQGDSRIFMLRILQPAAGDEKLYTSVFRSAGEMVLKVRSFLENSFSAEKEGTAADTPEDIRAPAVIGSWDGEEGIAMVRLLPQRRGIIVFSSGASMVVEYDIHENSLRVTQNVPNNIRFYYPLPPAAAEKMAAVAPPMEWEFMLYEKGTVLRGVKITAKANMADGALKEIVLRDVQDVEWKKRTER